MAHHAGMSIRPWRRWLEEKEPTTEVHRDKYPVDYPIAWDIDRVKKQKIDTHEASGVLFVNFLG